jgi:ribonuclease G
VTRLIIAAHAPLLCAALEQQDGVSDVYATRLDGAEQTGAVVQATVTRRIPRDGAAIVRWQTPTGEQEGYWANAGDTAAGATVRLQIKHAAQADKLPQLTRDIALLGRFLVHLPAGSGIKRSRRHRGSVPDCLQNTAGGWIVRHTALPATQDALAQEAAYVLALAKHATLPAPTCWQRAIIEHGTMLTAILVAEMPLLRAVQAWLAAAAPDLLPLLQHAPDALDWDGLLTTATALTVPLPDGGRLTIVPTRAFWAVDVDAGSATQQLATNVAAARALAQQLRLRNMGGVIVVDFISMNSPAERAHLLTALRHAVAADPAGVEVFGMSKLGLVELTRTRRGLPLHALLGQPINPDKPMAF